MEKAEDDVVFEWLVVHQDPALRLFHQISTKSEIDSILENIDELEFNPGSEYGLNTATRSHTWGDVDNWLPLKIERRASSSFASQ